MTRETGKLFTHEVMPTERIRLGNGSKRAPIPPAKQVLYASLWSMAIKAPAINQKPTRAVAGSQVRYYTEWCGLGPEKYHKWQLIYQVDSFNGLIVSASYKT